MPLCGQRLVWIPDLVRLLSRIAPVIDARLAAAGFAHLEGDLTITLFRSAVRLRFAAERLVAVEDAGFVDASMGAVDLLIPTDAFVRLVFGFRGIAEPCDAWPEMWVRPAAAGLVDVKGGPRYELDGVVFEVSPPVAIPIPTGTLDGDLQSGPVSGVFVLFGAVRKLAAHFRERVR